MYHIFFCPANKAEGVEEASDWLYGRDAVVTQASDNVERNNGHIRQLRQHRENALVVVMAPMRRTIPYYTKRVLYTVGRGVHTTLEQAARSCIKPYLLRRAIDGISWELVPINKLTANSYASLSDSASIEVGKEAFHLPADRNDQSDPFDNNWAPTPIQMPTPITPPVSEPIVRPSVAWIYLNR